MPQENVKVKGEFDDSDSDEGSEDSEEPAKAWWEQVAKQVAIGVVSEALAACKSHYLAAPVVAPKRRRKEAIICVHIVERGLDMKGLDMLVYELILRVAQPGEGVLVFLPGIGEISDLQETLMPLEDVDQQVHMSWTPGMERNDLHFKVLDEQEGAVFDPPPPDTPGPQSVLRAHIILASNIAESSLTIPKVRVVIDFGLRRQLIYDKRRHMSCLVTTWVSQASAKQRCGRTGRVFEGVNIRLYTKQFFDSYMDEPGALWFDPPEMQTAPLEKLYVNVTPSEFRKRTPKELLWPWMLVAQPPEERQSLHLFTPAKKFVQPGTGEGAPLQFENLDQLGALTNNTESAELTVLGCAMTVQLCRLVIFGSLLGMPCVRPPTRLADPFTLPSHLIMKDPKEYAEAFSLTLASLSECMLCMALTRGIFSGHLKNAVRRSYETRRYFDHGHWQMAEAGEADKELEVPKDGTMDLIACLDALPTSELTSLESITSKVAGLFGCLCSGGSGENLGLRMCFPWRLHGAVGAGQRWLPTVW
ncbi:ATP-dependent RNA helicase TDRD9 (Tudor domain-containing protein 9) [Durusdinium trenchii]|uniref:ATP-dependent RNA helicase TDRD9 (Tudor domain-containing protein 9) n=1 Tax=Durusdinium trenchii TaxID=1381693 RepID=A0ABP0HSI9_9DINO